jgi:TonB family protein
MTPRKRRHEKRRGSPFLWFVLISLIVHHAVVISVVRVPDMSRYETVEVQYVQHDETAEEIPEPEVPELEAVEPTEPFELPRSEDEKRVAEKKKHKPEEPEPPKPEEQDQPEKDEAKPPDELITLVQVEGLHFVDIKDHESEEPPPDAKFFAPINSQVDEETRAENTNLDEDQGMSQPASEGDPDKTPGDSPDSLAAHLEQEEQQPVKDSPDSVKPEDPEYVDVTPQPAGATKDKETGSFAKKSPESEPIVLPTLSPDNAPPVKIAKSDDGEILDLADGLPVPSFKQAKKSKEKSGAHKPGPDAKLAELDMSWTQMEGVLGAEMKELKEAWKESKKAKHKGGYTENIGKVFSQLENFNPDVKPGNQTALNAAYHPYAEYITAFHRKLHPQWGDGFLASLMTKPNGDPLNDMSLMVKLEFVIEEDGSIEKVTVVRSSGNLVYDVAAIDAIYAGQPYPPPPDIIKSYDDKVYMRWGMYRNHSQCGVWNAEPYILAAPKQKKKVKPPKEKQPSVGAE